MRSRILLVAIFCLLYSNISAQEYHEIPINKDYYDSIIKHVNRENSLSANLAYLKKKLLALYSSKRYDLYILRCGNFGLV